MVVVEAKAFYSFDVLAIRSFAKYIRFILDDLDKARRVEGSPEIYMLTLVTNVLDLVPIQLCNIVKHDHALRSASDPEPAHREIDEFLSGLASTQRFNLVGGSAFGIRVEVDMWLCGPIATQSPRLS